MEEHQRAPLSINGSEKKDYMTFLQRLTHLFQETLEATMHQAVGIGHSRQYLAQGNSNAYPDSSVHVCTL